MQQVIRFVDEKEEKTSNGILNMDFFTSDASVINTTDFDNVELAEVKTTKKKSTTKKKKKTIVAGQELLTGDDEQEEETVLPIYQSNTPYLETYNETNNMLKGSIYQIDTLQADIKAQLDQVNQSRTLKRKYDYVSLLSNTVSSLIATKVTAIREMNKTITDAHNLDMKRVKELNMSAANEQDDDKRIMDLYNAYISTPVGTSYPGAVPAQQAGPLTQMVIPYSGNYNPDPSISNMLVMDNPNVQTVVRFNSDTGERTFDVVDMSTGQSIPGMDKPDSMFLNDITIDTRNNVARDTNLNVTYPLIKTDPTLAKY